MSEEHNNEVDPQESTDPLTEASLQQHLNKYRQALESEYVVEVEKTPENVAELTTAFFKNNAAHAAAQIAWLAMNADSESVKLNAAKFIIQSANADAEADGDPIKDLLKQLTNNDAKATQTNATPSPSSERES